MKNGRFFTTGMPWFLIVYCVLCIAFFLLVADTQLYKRLCPSVRRSVGLSVDPSMMIESIRQEQAFQILFVYVCLGWGVERGVDDPAHPSATIM